MRTSVVSVVRFHSGSCGWRRSDASAAFSRALRALPAILPPGVGVRLEFRNAPRVLLPVDFRGGAFPEHGEDQFEVVHNGRGGSPRLSPLSDLYSLGVTPKAALDISAVRIS